MAACFTALALLSERTCRFALRCIARCIGFMIEGLGPDASSRDFLAPLAANFIA